MIADINFSYNSGVNYNSSLDTNDLLDEISSSMDIGQMGISSTISTDFCYDDRVDFSSGFVSDVSDIESNAIVKDVFNNIREEHNIDLSQDPVVVETLRALLYL